MIDPNNEPLIPLGAATAYLPRLRGRRVSAVTLWRWIMSGFGGVKLEAVKTSQGWHTSRAAIERFVAALSPRPARDRRRPWHLAAYRAKGAA